VVDELVTGHTDQPRDRHLPHALAPDCGDRRGKRLGGQILSDRDAATAREQVAVDLGQRDAIDRHDRVRIGWLRLGTDTPSSLGGGDFRHADRLRAGISRGTQRA